MEPATEISEFGTGLRAHLGLDHGTEPMPLDVDPEPAEASEWEQHEDLDVLALLEAELIEREREVALREAILAAAGGHAGVDELAQARERRRARSAS